MLTLSVIRSLSKEHGMLFCASTDLEAIENQIGRFRNWINKGYHGQMEYLKKSESRIFSPRELLPEGKSIVAFMIRHSGGSHPKLKEGHGRVARYAWGKDYHRQIGKRLKKIVRSIEEHLGRKINYRICCDAAPLSEKTVAIKSGIGFRGKNTLVVRPGIGSYFFLAEIIWDVEIEKDQSPGLKESCGSCTNCLSCCPSGALIGEYVLNAGRCISYLTIEKRGVLEDHEKEAIGSWIFGCDSCQDACPHNRSVLTKRGKADFPELQSGGCGPQINIAEVLAIRGEEQFSSRFGGTSIMRAKRENLLRNAAVVAGNTQAVCLTEPLFKAAQEDPSEIVRYHSLWALYCLREANSVQKKIKLKELMKGEGEREAPQISDRIRDHLESF